MKTRKNKLIGRTIGDLSRSLTYEPLATLMRRFSSKRQFQLGRPAIICGHRLMITLAVAGVASIVNAQSGLQHSEQAASGAAVEDLQPFTHTAFIPVGSDLSSFRFRDVKAVVIPTRKESAMDQHYCAEVAFRDPGGSMYCASVRLAGFTRAYEVTYSFDSQPLPSDEHGNRRFSFIVYFRPEELNPAEWELLARSRKARTDAAGSFELTTSRMLEERSVIDENHSTFCDGNYSDGAWVHTNDECQDQATLEKVMVPSDYITVQVEPKPSRYSSVHSSNTYQQCSITGEGIKNNLFSVLCQTYR